MKQGPFFIPKGKVIDKPMVIMLSGLPCTGKTTWRQQFVNEAQCVSLPVSVVSADDLAFQLRDEWNAAKTTTEPLTYSDICETYRNELNEQYHKALQNALAKPGIVILDRTYLTAERRQEVLKWLASDWVHCVHFVIHDEPAWQKHLALRNEADKEKKITAEIIQCLNKGASPPDTDEGFASVFICSAIGETHWQEDMMLNIADLIKTYRQAADCSPAHPNQVSTFS